MTMGHELRTLDAMNSSRLLMTKKNLGYELRTLNNMHSLSYGYQEYLKVVVDMNDFEL